jgi:integrase
VFEADARAERAANAYLGDLHGTFARPLTLRSYAYDILRWLRFLAAVGVEFDEAVRTDYIDFVRWLVEHGKTGGARRPRSAPRRGRLNRVTGKPAPDDRTFDPATIRHSRVVLHEWYEFLVDRGDGRPLVNPVPQSGRRDGSERRRYAHHNPLEPFGRERRARRVDPPNPKVVPRHMPEPQWEAFWADLTCDRDRAMAMASVDSGIRPGELLGLRGENLDWGNALVHVVRKGGRRTQWVPVSRAAIVWLRRYQAASGYVAGAADPVWVTTRGEQRPVTYDAWRAVFMRVNRRLGTNWTPHDLRHTACVRMLDAGMALHKVQEIMGHEHLTTTERYLRPRLDELIEAHSEAMAAPRPSPSGPGAYAPGDLDVLLGRQGGR